MVASIASSGPSVGRANVHCFTSGELQFARRIAASAAEPTYTSRTEWSLSLERPQERSVCASLSRKNPAHRRDEVNVGKGPWRSSKLLAAPVSAIASEDATCYGRDATVEGWFDGQDGFKGSAVGRSKSSEGIQTWDIFAQDLQFCELKARQDVLTMRLIHEKVVGILNPLARDQRSVDMLRKELADLQSQLAKAHDQVHLSEARVGRALEKLSEMETLVKRMIPEDLQQITQLTSQPSLTAVSEGAVIDTAPSSSRRTQGLVVAGPIKEFSPALKNFWYPVAFTDDINKDTMVPFECFDEPWVLFRGEKGRVGCVRNSCAHRACPLHLGEVKDGRIQCPYHGWEYATNGRCEKMPSTKPVKVSIQALPCVERDGMVWIWPGDDVPDQDFPDLSAPPGYTTHAQIIIELPVEHGLLMENLLDLAHAPFTHTSTFAKGWPVPSLVKFCTPVKALQGYWDPYPIDMEFRPPCMVRSTIGISKPGKLEGTSTQDCLKHLHQLHVCLPSSRGKTRLLYRLSLDFLPILKHVPYIQSLWKYLANQVLEEDLRLVLGQQDRMIRGANVWNSPVSYDKLGVRYRKWRISIEQRDARVNDTHSHLALDN